MATIYFSSGLTPYTDGVESLTVDAPRVHELLSVVLERFPALREPISIMAIAVDGHVHLHADFVPLAPHSEVHLVPRITGG